MPANVDGMVREGISAYRAGKKDEARALLMRAVEIDEHHEQAWLWLSAVVESTEEQVICLENVLAINPANERARQGLAMLRAQKPAASAPPKADDDILASASFTADFSPFSPFTTGLEGDADELPTSIEWAASPLETPLIVDPPTATSSASSIRAVPEPSASEYDDWVSNLNLGSKGGSSLLDDMLPTAVNDDVAQFMSGAFEEEEDDLSSLRDASIVDDDLLAGGPFSTADLDTMPAAEALPRPAVETRLPAAAEADSVLDDLVSDDLPLEIEEDYDHATLDAPDPSELFRFIPQEITPTRLPGTVERYPLLVILGLLAGIALNIGAVALLVSQLVAN